MRLLLTAPRSELGTAVTRAHGRDSDGPAVMVNIAQQRPNTLLHDGHAWWADPGAHILSSTRRALTVARRRDAAFVVHASYAFLQGAEGGAAVGARLRPIVDAARRAEDMVLESGLRACVVRLGYLYGPTWKDLRAYRRAFRLGRPYWAGPRGALHHHLYGDDAARALLSAAKRRPAGRITYATDGSPASFADFMDHFARLVSRPRPLHIPGLGRQFVQLVVDELHMQAVELPASGRASPQLPGWRPRVTSYQSGLDEVIEAWMARH